MKEEASVSGTGVLPGKTAVVTGASSGIGRAIALRYGREGATVYVIADKNVDGGEQTAAMIRRDGGSAIFIQCDVSNPDQVQRMIEDAVSESGRLDIIVNNAGTGDARKVEDLPIEAFHHVLNINLAGAFYCSKFAIPHLRAAGGGSIINVASVYGLIAAPNIPAYSTSKGGLIMLTKQMAVDYSHEGIRVNCICPGFVDTDLGGRRARMTPEDRERAQADREARAAMQPIGRQAQPEEIAGAAVYLAGDDGSFTVGSVMVVDGGESILHNIGPYF